MANDLIGNDCPYCHGSMTVKQMTCRRCNVTIDAAFPFQRLANLPVEHQRFIEMFVLAGGSLKEIASQTGVSYPTIRSRLDKVIESLQSEIARTAATDGEGRMTAEDAARLIKSIWPGQAGGHEEAGGCKARTRNYLAGSGPSSAV